MKFDFSSQFGLYSQLGFFIAFFALFGLVNYQPLAIFFLYFGFHNVGIWSAVIVLAYMIGHWMGSKYKNRIAAFLHSCSTLWLGTIFLAWSITVLLGLISLIWTPPVATSAAIIGFGTIILASISFYLGHSFITTEHNIHLKGIMQKLKMVQLSDLHLHGLEARTELAHILNKVTVLHPDIIVITGDLLDVPGLVDNTILQQFNQFDIPILFVSGNHDRYLGMDKVTRALADTKIKILRNEEYTWQNITFVGLDDNDSSKTLKAKLPVVVKTNPHILLFHKPTTPQIAAERGYSMMLSGHTHNGQIFPFTIIVRLAYKYIKGLHRVGNMWLYINQGTGTWAVPMRLGSRNEVAVFNLYP